MKRKFIINANAGRGLDVKQFNQIQAFFQKHLGDFDFDLPKSAPEAKKMARKAALNNYGQIISLGGDGTLHQIIQGLMENDKPINPDLVLAVAPIGTGSDFFKGLSKDKLIKDWKSVVLNYQVSAVDLGLAETGSGRKEFFINMAGIGMSSLVVKLKEENPNWLPKRLSYIVPTLKSMAQFAVENVEIKADKKSITSSLIGLFISNGRYAGGGMKFAPKAVLDDGLFDITLIKKMPPLKMISQAYRLYQDDLESDDQIQRFRVKSISVETPGVGLELDGDYIGPTPVKIQNLEKRIKICVPAI